MNAPDAPGSSSIPIVVEVFGLRVVDEVLHWVVSSGPLPSLQAPDERARELAEVTAGAQPGVVLHSTSWRYTGGELVVTYALFPDLRVGAGQPLRQHLVTGTGPLEPSPVAVAAGHVAAHAVRHLADLAADRDPHVVSCARERPHAWHLLAQHARAVHVDHALTAVPAPYDLGPTGHEHPAVTPGQPWTRAAAL